MPRGANVIKLSQRDLLDYRAVQRTFDGAYARTALGQLCYAIVILRLFQPKFFYVGECVFPGHNKELQPRSSQSLTLSCPIGPLLLMGSVA